MRNKLTLVLIAGLLMLAAPAAFACSNLEVNADAAMAGSNFGLEVAFDGVDLSACYVQDSTPNSETVYSAFFRMKKAPDYAMTLGSGHEFFRATGNGKNAIEARIRFFNAAGGETFIQVQARKDDNTLSNPIIAIAPGQSGWKMEWQASSAPGANDGVMRLLIRQANGTFLCLKEVTGIDNDTYVVNNQRLGAMGGIAASTTGSLYFDTFESFRTIEASPSCQISVVDS